MEISIASVWDKLDLKERRYILKSLGYRLQFAELSCAKLPLSVRECITSPAYQFVAAIDLRKAIMLFMDSLPLWYISCVACNKTLVFYQPENESKVTMYLPTMRDTGIEVNCGEPSLLCRPCKSKADIPKPISN